MMEKENTEDNNKGSGMKKRKRIKSMYDDNESEENECEKLIARHKNVQDCYLMVYGYKKIYNTFYFCNCDEECKFPICLACIEKCHKPHHKDKEINDFIKGNLNEFCQCGLKNHILPDIDDKINNIYITQCLFLEWSITTKNSIFYENKNQKSELLCMFCYNLCKNKSQNYIKKCDDVLCERLECSDKHENILTVYDKIAQLTNEDNFQFEGLSGVQFLNMLLMSKKSFNNSFYTLFQAIENMKRDFPNKTTFNFNIYVNNSPFMKALEKFDNILLKFKYLFYNEDLIDIRKLIYLLLQKKFDFKSQENVWVLKKYLFYIFHKMTFRKNFEIIPFLSVPDILNFHPFQRMLYCEFIELFPQKKRIFTEGNDYQKTLVEELLTTLEKYKNIKNKSEIAYEILRIIYSQIKKLVILNVFTIEEYMKLFNLNDDIICISIEDKSDKFSFYLAQIRMLYQIVKSLLFISYFYNDSQIKKYLKNEINIQQVNFLHGDCEISKMIYKNFCHVLLLCRTIYENTMFQQKMNNQNIQNDKNINNDQNSVNDSIIFKKIIKINDKILLKSTEIIALTLNTQEQYYFGMKRILFEKCENYLNILNGVYTIKELEVINLLSNLCLEMEKVYYDFFKFVIKQNEIQKFITNKIQDFFDLINYTEKPKLGRSTVILKDNNESNFKNNNNTKYSLVISSEDEEKDDNFKIIRILINKTPFLFSLIKSLEILSLNNNESNIEKTYISQLFLFLNFYAHNSPDNCLVLLSSKVLKALILLHIEYLPLFIDLLEYIIKTHKKLNICFGQNNMLFKVIEKLVIKIIDKSEFILYSRKLLGIINKLCHFNYLYLENNINKIRKIIKNIVNNIQIFSHFKDLLIKKENNKSFEERINNKEMINNFSILNCTLLFTKFLKIINYIFDGNSTLDESDFMSKIFSPEEILNILEDKTLFLPLRIELIRFYRLAYLDIIINQDQINKYEEVIASDIKEKNNFNSRHLILFEHLLSVSHDEKFIEKGILLIDFEIKNFKKIYEKHKNVEIKFLLSYFKNCIIIPLYVFSNICFSMIDSFDGIKYVKIYEFIFYYLVTKEKLLEIIKENKDTNIEELKKHKLHFIYENLINEDMNELKEDISKMKTITVIVDYNLFSDIFYKHSNKYYKLLAKEDLDDIFKKKAEAKQAEEIEERREEYSKIKFQNLEFQVKIINLINKYEKDKINFNNSGLFRDLATKNYVYNTTYRKIILQAMFYLINDEKLYAKYRWSNLWLIFRLLQYDTSNTQRDILKMIKADRIQIKKGMKNNISKIDNLIQDKNNNEDKNDDKKLEVINENDTPNLTKTKMDSANIEENKVKKINKIVDLDYLLEIFVENYLSVIYSNCNPSTFEEELDYKIGYLIIKIMKYMCEEHNDRFQTIFFDEIRVKVSSIKISTFDFMMCALQKILVFARWKDVNYDSKEENFSYFYDLFFCIIEFAIEMIQGTSSENITSIIDSQYNKNENSFFYKFLVEAHSILFNNNNDSEIIYNIRINIVNFIQAFIEEKNAPEKIIVIISNVFNPISMFEISVNILKKLYLKSIGEDIRKESTIEFDGEKSKLFIDKYFSDEDFFDNKEFELANSIFYYIKSLSNLNNKDALSIIECTKTYDEEKLINLRALKKKIIGKNDGNMKDNFIDPRYFEIFYVVRFFEAITKIIWVQGEDQKLAPQYVIFTVNPVVLYLSENTKTDFFKNTARGSRSSKLLDLMENTNYFLTEMKYSKDKLSNNKFINLLYGINFQYSNYLILLMTVIINLLIFGLAESKDSANNYRYIFKKVLPLGIIQTLFSFIFLIIMIITKFPLYFQIEEEKYYISHRIGKEEKLVFLQYLNILLNIIISRREAINLLWNCIFSILGISSLFAYSLQILIIMNMVSTLRIIIKALIKRYRQLFMYIMLLLITIIIFSNIAFYLFSKEFIHENEGVQENTCGSLFLCFLSHLEFGLRTDGGIGEYMHKLSYSDNKGYFIAVFFFQFSFYVIVVTIMLAIIGNTIIDSFSEYKEKSENDLNYIRNICFICHGNRDEIEKGGETFEEHVNKLHNIWDYVSYMIGLKYVDPQETNAINSFVIEQLEKKRISWFPSFKKETEPKEENQKKKAN